MFIETIKTHLVAIILTAVTVGGLITVPIVLGSDDVIDPQVDQEIQEEQVNEDGCPVGEFLNYYGVCQDEHAYEPQECPEGERWGYGDVIKDNGDGTASVDYEATYGIDGLPVGRCIHVQSYEEYCEMYANKPGAAPCSTTKYGLEEKEIIEYNYSNTAVCERGFYWSKELNACYDMRAWHRYVYEKHVLGWDVKEPTSYGYDE